uniref:SAM domain-containing protein n=1 Tax=Trichuris muris TaxID=70415 RepID=A0A5S6Q8K8_TRIMR
MSSFGLMTTRTSFADECGDLGVSQTDLINALRSELQRNKRALSAMRTDRKQLRCEKADLLNRMEDVYQALEMKDKKLREFVQEFETKMYESNQGVRKVILEKEKLLQERNELARSLQIASAELLLLQQSLSQEQCENTRLQDQLMELRGRFLLLTGKTPYSCADGEVAGISSATGQEPEAPMDAPAESTAQSLESLFEPSVNDGDSRSYDRTPCGCSCRHCSKQNDFRSQENNRVLKFLNFIRSNKARKELLDIEFDNNPMVQDLDLAERAENLIIARRIPLKQWCQSHIDAWLRLELGMSQYAAAFELNIKSGKALLELSDVDMESTLGIFNPMHKKKLRLAIEEYQVPSLCKYPHLKEITHLHVCNTFLPSIGLSQHVKPFLSNLIDGRMLNYLNKKHLGKYLGITKSLHQKSILYGVELLRMACFDIKLMAKKRTACERTESNLLWWTNDRLIHWMWSIDLAEYAGNLKNSGVHGALLVLDPQFGSDQLADLLNIPSSKQMVRRHLRSNFERLLAAERMRLLSLCGKNNSSAAPVRCSNSEVQVIPRYPVNGNFHNIIEKDIYNVQKGQTNGKAHFAKMTNALCPVAGEFGSSIDRSQHMKAILGTPHVLAHAPMTGLNAEAPSHRHSTTYITSASNGDKAMHFNVDRISPAGLSPTRAKFIPLRKMKSFINRNGGNKPRPHSIGDFNISLQSGHVLCKLGLRMLPLATKLKSWLSVDRLNSDAQVDAEGMFESDRSMSTIIEYAETETEHNASDALPPLISAGPMNQACSQPAAKNCLQL